MKTIVIFSGKGGVGKTNFVAALSLVASRKNKIIVSDCDVDTPNLYLMLGLKKVMHKKSIWGREKPYFAKKCGEKFKEKVKVCPFDAIYWDKKSKELKINKFLCEGCGLCMHFFPKGYIRLKREKIGKKVVGLTNFGFKIVYGDLEIGERESGLIVSEIRETARDIGERDSSEFLIVDSASGIGCPVIASIKNADLLVIIFEPTLMSFEYGKRAITLYVKGERDAKKYGHLCIEFIRRVLATVDYVTALLIKAKLVDHQKLTDLKNDIRKRVLEQIKRISLESYP